MDASSHGDDPYTQADRDGYEIGAMAALLPDEDRIGLKILIAAQLKLSWVGDDLPTDLLARRATRIAEFFGE